MPRITRSASRRKLSQDSAEGDSLVSPLARSAKDRPVVADYQPVGRTRFSNRIRQFPPDTVDSAPVASPLAREANDQPAEADDQPLARTRSATRRRQSVQDAARRARVTSPSAMEVEGKPTEAKDRSMAPSVPVVTPLAMETEDRPVEADDQPMEADDSSALPTHESRQLMAEEVELRNLCEQYFDIPSSTHNELLPDLLPPPFTPIPDEALEPYLHQSQNRYEKLLEAGAAIQARLWWRLESGEILTPEERHKIINVADFAIMLRNHRIVMGDFGHDPVIVSRPALRLQQRHDQQRRIEQAAILEKQLLLEGRAAIIYFTALVLVRSLVRPNGKMPIVEPTLGMARAPKTNDARYVRVKACNGVHLWRPTTPSERDNASPILRAMQLIYARNYASQREVVRQLQQKDRQQPLQHERVFELTTSTKRKSKAEIIDQSRPSTADMEKRRRVLQRAVILLKLNDLNGEKAGERSEEQRRILQDSLSRLPTARTEPTALRRRFVPKPSPLARQEELDRREAAFIREATELVMRWRKEDKENAQKAAEQRKKIEHARQEAHSAHSRVQERQESIVHDNIRSILQREAPLSSPSLSEEERRARVVEKAAAGAAAAEARRAAAEARRAAAAAEAHRAAAAAEAHRAAAAAEAHRALASDHGGNTPPARRRRRPDRNGEPRLKKSRQNDPPAYEVYGVEPREPAPTRMPLAPIQSPQEVRRRNMNDQVAPHPAMATRTAPPPGEPVPSRMPFPPQEVRRRNGNDQVAPPHHPAMATRTAPPPRGPVPTRIFPSSLQPLRIQRWNRNNQVAPPHHPIMTTRSAPPPREPVPSRMPFPPQEVRRRNGNDQVAPPHHPIMTTRSAPPPRGPIPTRMPFTPIQPPQEVRRWNRNDQVASAHHRIMAPRFAPPPGEPIPTRMPPASVQPPRETQRWNRNGQVAPLQHPVMATRFAPPPREQSGMADWEFDPRGHHVRSNAFAVLHDAPAPAPALNLDLFSWSSNGRSPRGNSINPPPEELQELEAYVADEGDGHGATNDFNSPFDL